MRWNWRDKTVGCLQSRPDRKSRERRTWAPTKESLRYNTYRCRRVWFSVKGVNTLRRNIHSRFFSRFHDSEFIFFLSFFVFFLCGRRRIFHLWYEQHWHRKRWSSHREFRFQSFFFIFELLLVVVHWFIFVELSRVSDCIVEVGRVVGVRSVISNWFGLSVIKVFYQIKMRLRKYKTNWRSSQLVIMS